MSAGITLTTRLVRCSTNTLVEKARAADTSVIRELGVWEVVDRPHDELVFGTRWVDIKKECRSTSVKQIGHASQQLLHSKHYEAC